MSTATADILAALRADLTAFLRENDGDTAALAAGFFELLDESMFGPLVMSVALPTLIADVRRSNRWRPAPASHRVQGEPWHAKAARKLSEAGVTQERLEDHFVWLGGDVQRRLLECSAGDLRAATDTYTVEGDRLRQAMLEKAQQYAALAGYMDARGAATVADVPVVVVREYLFDD